MAPKRRKQRSPHQGREFKLRIPEDVAERIEADAKREQRPMNRIVINNLADVPRWREQETMAILLGHMSDSIDRMGKTLAHHGERIDWQDLSDQLLATLDKALAAEGSAQQAALDKVRVLRATMLKSKATTRE
jgi:hypothetical protein